MNDATEKTDEEVLQERLDGIETKLATKLNERDAHDRERDAMTAEIVKLRQRRSLLRKALGLPVNEPKPQPAEEGN
jgi:hypothetical protein